MGRRAFPRKQIPWLSFLWAFGSRPARASARTAGFGSLTADGKEGQGAKLVRACSVSSLPRHRGFQRSRKPAAGVTADTFTRVAV